MGQPETIRLSTSRAQYVIGLIICGLLWLAGLSIAVQSSLFIGLFVIASSIVGSYHCVKLSHPGMIYLELSPNGLHERSPTTSRTLSWREIDEFFIVRHVEGPTRVGYRFFGKESRLRLDRWTGDRASGIDGVLEQNYRMAAEDLATLLNEWHVRYGSKSVHAEPPTETDLAPEQMPESRYSQSLRLHPRRGMLRPAPFACGVLVFIPLALVLFWIFPAHAWTCLLYSGLGGLAVLWFVGAVLPEWTYLELTPSWFDERFLFLSRRFWWSDIDGFSVSNCENGNRAIIIQFAETAEREFPEPRVAVWNRGARLWGNYGLPIPELVELLNVWRLRHGPTPGPGNERKDDRV